MRKVKPDKHCRWCGRADRKVNVQGFCCQLCYNSWFSEQVNKSHPNQTEQRQRKEGESA